MSKILFSTILDQIKNSQTIADKALILQNNNSPMLRQLLMAGLDPKYNFDVILPSYRENKETDGYASNSLHIEYRRLYIFLDGYTQVTPKRKTALLCQILESIDNSDTLVLIDVIKKDLSKYGLSAEVVNTAFPGLINV